jgi:hypothetical protein
MLTIDAPASQVRATKTRIYTTLFLSMTPVSFTPALKTPATGAQNFSNRRKEQT